MAVKQAVDSNTILRAICKASCRAVAENFCDYTYVYTRGMMSEYCSSEVNYADGTYVSAVYNVNS